MTRQVSLRLKCRNAKGRAYDQATRVHYPPWRSAVSMAVGSTGAAGQQMRRGEDNMPYQKLITFVALAMLSIQFEPAQAFDDTKYPSFDGQWSRLATPG